MRFSNLAVQSLGLDLDFLNDLEETKERLLHTVFKKEDTTRLELAIAFETLGQISLICNDEIEIDQPDYFESSKQMIGENSGKYKSSAKDWLQLLLVVVKRARIYIDKEDYKSAEDVIRYVLKRNIDYGHREQAVENMCRLARIMCLQGNWIVASCMFDEAFSLLRKGDDVLEFRFLNYYRCQCDTFKKVSRMQDVGLRYFTLLSEGVNLELGLLVDGLLHLGSFYLNLHSWETAKGAFLQASDMLLFAREQIHSSDPWYIRKTKEVADMLAITKKGKNNPRWNDFDCDYRLCEVCEEIQTLSKSLYCFRCRIVFYCGMTCAKKDFENHKQVCKTMCLVCRKKTTKKCSVCQLVYYCGPECQKQDWDNGHKHEH